MKKKSGREIKKERKSKPGSYSDPSDQPSKPQKKREDPPTGRSQSQLQLVSEGIRKSQAREGAAEAAIASGAQTIDRSIGLLFAGGLRTKWAWVKSVNRARKNSYNHFH